MNCDNQLMSGTRLSHEFALLVSELGYDLDGLRRLTVNAARSAFLPYDQREALIADVIEPGDSQPLLPEPTASAPRVHVLNSAELAALPLSTCRTALRQALGRSAGYGHQSSVWVSTRAVVSTSLIGTDSFGPWARQTSPGP